MFSFWEVFKKKGINFLSEMIFSYLIKIKFFICQLTKSNLIIL